jgi:dethiobiotin synthetase
VLGVAFVGDPQEDSERTICEIARVKRLGRLPMLDPLNQATLSRAFSENFHLGDFG